MSRPLSNDPSDGAAEEPQPEPDNPDRPLRGPAWARTTIESEPPAEERSTAMSTDAPTTGAVEGESGP